MSFSASAPYDGVVYITDTIGNEDFQGSGVLIAPNLVLTAAHVVYQAGVGAATNIKVSPGYDQGIAPFGSAYALSYNYNPVADYNDEESLPERFRAHQAGHLLRRPDDIHSGIKLSGRRRLCQRLPRQRRRRAGIPCPDYQPGARL